MGEYLLICCTATHKIKSTIEFEVRSRRGANEVTMLTSRGYTVIIVYYKRILNTRGVISTRQLWCIQPPSFLEDVIFLLTNYITNYFKENYDA